MASRRWIVSIAGAAVGAALGYLGFRWFLNYGFYALVLPGGLMGVGATVGRVRSLPFAIVLTILAIALGLYAEWSTAPFKTDPSLGYFLQNVHKLTPVTILMILIGAAVAFWGAYDFTGRARAK